MKYLVLFGVLLVVYLVWRSAQRRDAAAAAPKAPPATPALPQDMVQCPVCSVHLPRGDALPGVGGALYCSPEHRLKDQR
jgi:uncharacterized protein